MSAIYSLIARFARLSNFLFAHCVRSKKFGKVEKYEKSTVSVFETFSRVFRGFLRHFVEPAPFLENLREPGKSRV